MPSHLHRVDRVALKHVATLRNTPSISQYPNGAGICLGFVTVVPSTPGTWCLALAEFTIECQRVSTLVNVTTELQKLMSQQ